MSVISTLPIEIMSKILGLLESGDKYKCMLVNKEFYSSTMPELWRNLVISTMNQLYRFINCLNGAENQIGINIKSIRFGWYSYVSDDELLYILALAPNLEELKISYAQELTDKSIMAIPQYCKFLTHFQLGYSSVSNHSVQVLGQCNQLRKLTLVECNMLDSNALKPFAHLPINYLDLTGCSWLTVNETARDLRLFTHLTDLNIEDCDPIPTDFLHFLTTDDTGKPYLPYLKRFGVSSYQISDDDIIPFLKAHQDIRELFLFSPGITDRTLENITHLSHLQYLGIKSRKELSPPIVRKLVNQCTKLSKFILSGLGLTYHDFPEAEPNNSGGSPAVLVAHQYSSDSVVFKWSCTELNRIRDYCLKRDNNIIERKI